MKAVYTLRPSSREDRGCVCPFPPGCWSTPCRSRGTRWEIRDLVRRRYQWATASATTVISEDRRAGEIARINEALAVARDALRWPHVSGW